MPTLPRPQDPFDSRPKYIEESCILLRLDEAVLQAEFTSVRDPRGVVILASGSGSGRHSPRNRYVAESLRSNGKLATLLVDLLARGETTSYPSVQKLTTDVALLARRLVQATDWVTRAFDLGGLPIGYLGASSGAAAALVASTQCPAVHAVVSRGGRPELAGDVLGQVRAPTLFIAGREDDSLLESNRAAQSLVAGPSELLIVPGSSSLFEEPRALEEVVTGACTWFRRHLGPEPDALPKLSVRRQSGK